MWLQLYWLINTMLWSHGSANVSTTVYSQYMLDPSSMGGGCFKSVSHGRNQSKSFLIYGERELSPPHLWRAGVVSSSSMESGSCLLLIYGEQELSPPHLWRAGVVSSSSMESKSCLLLIMRYCKPKYFSGQKIIAYFAQISSIFNNNDQWFPSSLYTA